MIERGNKVQYIGNDSKAYLDRDNPKGTDTGRKGKVISDPYQLSAVKDTFFVDVEWLYESKPKDAFLNHKLGHVVNVKNLKKI